MDIYRIEDEDGHGVFQAIGERLMAFMMTKHDVDGLGYRQFHPPPRHDSLLVRNLERSRYFMSNYHFGFHSVGQLKTWFFDDEIIQLIHDAEFHISHYKIRNVADYVCEGNAQMCFMLDKATLYNIIPMDSLLSNFDDEEDDEKLL
jgi:hypothetical protein